jgi:hypothetical protein
MRVGPLPSAWVHAWALDAGAAMRLASTHSVPMPFKVGKEFFERNLVMLTAFVEAARRGGDVFSWEGDGDPDELVVVMQYWRNLAEVRHDLVVGGAAPSMDPDAERFSQALRRAILDVLVVAGRMTADHADRLEATWPRLSAPADGDVTEDERHPRGATR